VSGSAFEYSGWRNGFIIRRNIQNFEQQLTFETNATTRGRLLELIVEEKAKLAELPKS
jgi:hypothetical protein